MQRKVVLLYGCCAVPAALPCANAYYRGDGACGKTSLVNVFTRGSVTECLQIDISGLCALTYLRYFPTV